MTLETLEALAFSDRAAACESLVAGSEERDHWRIVHHQQRGELDAADALLATFAHRHGDGGRLPTLRRRQVLLRADQDLPAHADALASDLGYTFDHPRRAAHAPAVHPSRWALPDPGALLALGRAADHDLRGFTDAGLRELPFGRHAEVHLSRLAWGGVEGLVPAIAAQLRGKSGVTFGQVPVHRALTRAELDALAELVPALRTDREWVLERLLRHRPGAGVDLDLDLPARVAWLDQCSALVVGLPPAFAELQVHVAQHRLAADQLLDTVDAARLLAYLHLPRRVSYARPDWLARFDPRHVASFGEDFAKWTGLARLGDDSALVRDQLVTAFTRGAAPEPFRDVLDRDFVDAVYAEVALVTGAAEPDRWARALGEVRAGALRDRVELVILPHNPRMLGSQDEVVVELDVKNAWPLQVRVFRVDVAAAFAAGRGDVPFDLDLDGLGARVERVVAGGQAPLRRSRVRVPLPECDRPGTWIVEFVGNGVASRVMLRKGDLRAATRTTSAGVELTVLDEAGAVRSDAVAWCGGRAHRPHADGTITLPFGTGRVPVLLVAGDLAVPTTVHLPPEQVELSVAVWLDRQSLVAGCTASLVVRPSLAIAGAPATLELLEDAWVEVATLDRTGVPGLRRVPVAPTDAGELVVPLVVPEHLSSLTVAVGGGCGSTRASATSPSAPSGRPRSAVLPSPQTLLAPA